MPPASSITGAAQQLEQALGAVDGVRIQRMGRSTIDPPALLVSPPSIRWEAYCDAPTSATFHVFLVLSPTEKVLERMWDFIPTVAQAITEYDEAVVTSAEPSTFNAEGTDMPAYDFTTEVAL